MVLGGAGFLGSHLCERLLADGAFEVISIDNFSTGSERNLVVPKAHGRFVSLHHDITEPFRLDGSLDLVFNLASPASSKDWARRPLETLRVGALGTQHALELARSKGAVFLQASSADVYGDPRVHPQPEDYFGHVNPTGPRACYVEAQRYAEALVSTYRRVHPLRTRIARIFNTYGPRMRLDDGRVVPTFLGQALREEDFTVLGDGRQTRSFCYVSDLVDGLVRLALSDVEEPVNLGSPRELSILQLVETVRVATGSVRPIVFKPPPEDDPQRRQPDLRRARAKLGWEPRVSLEFGLRETLTYFRVMAERPAPLPVKSANLVKPRPAPVSVPFPAEHLDGG